MAEKDNKAFDWDDEILEDGDDFVVLPPGDYYFRVESCAKKQHPGSEKLPPCNKVELKIRLFSDEGEVVVNHNLFLLKRMERMISNFFIGIGQKKKGESFRMNFEKVVGAEGKAKVGIRTYNGNQYNEIKRFYAPDEYLAKQEADEDGFAW